MKRHVAEAFLRARREGQGAGGGLSSRIPLPAKRALALLRVEAKAKPVELLSRLTGSDVVVVEAARFAGTFEIDRRSHIFRRLLVDAFERHLAELVGDLVEPGDVVVDIGANIGLFTVLAARRASRGRVFAAEASPAAAGMLRRNVGRNGLENVVLFEGAVSNHGRGMTLHLSEGNEEYASLGGINHPNAPRQKARAVEVASATLDDLLSEHGLRPQLLKVDVEGAEGLVFEGAEATLTSVRPILLCELDDRLLSALGYRARDVGAGLEAKGYQVWDAHTGEAFSPASGDDYVGEILALPSNA